MVMEILNKTINNPNVDYLKELFNFWTYADSGWTYSDNNGQNDYEINKGFIRLWNNYSAASSFSNSSSVTTLISPNLRPLLNSGKIISFAAHLFSGGGSAGYYNTSGNTRYDGLTHPYLIITDGASNSQTLADCYASSSVYQGSAAALAFIHAFFNIKLEGNNLTINVQGFEENTNATGEYYHPSGTSGSGLSSSSSSNLITTSTVIDVSTWTDIKIKLYCTTSAVPSGDSAAERGFISISPIINSEYKIGSKTTEK